MSAVPKVMPQRNCGVVLQRLDTNLDNEHYRAWLGWMCFESVATIMDVVQHFFSPSQPIHAPSDIDEISDDDLFCLEPRALDHPDSHSVAEDESEFSRESLAMQVVASQTSIPVPHIYRLATYGFGQPEYRRIYFAMEHIPGRPLSVVWPTLSWFGRLRVALTLRSYIRQLRKIQHPRSLVPGPLAPPGMGGQEFFSPLWVVPADERGPFDTYDEFMELLDQARKRSISVGQHSGLETSLTPQEAFDSSRPLVLTHSDLIPRNIVVGDDGHLWLIDFGWAGFFPVWWEFAAMREQADGENPAKEGLSWDAIIPLTWFARVGNFEVTQYSLSHTSLAHQRT
ncbi:hypothetical protein EUX98_g7728 [Antrodiella citrinella]|uniref:Aminoglycoside phosphotransferase domain-containing protein n=1 Tax=Antrodiella citrinella TaxID=2447956 RepID=A0A4S4MSX5_9APHY|nr:hypothetical protein EUX98_g7728 [Antrodiella citrinella]